MEFVLIWILLSLVVGAFSAARGHSFLAGFFFSMLLSPLIAGLIVAVRKPNVAMQERKALHSGEAKKCPACAELVKAEAAKCRYCGEVLAAAGVPPEPAKRQCSNCQTIMVGDSTHCGHCGEALGISGMPVDSRISAEERAGM